MNLYRKERCTNSWLSDEQIAQEPFLVWSDDKVQPTQSNVPDRGERCVLRVSPLLPPQQGHPLTAW